MKIRHASLFSILMLLCLSGAISAKPVAPPSTFDSRALLLLQQMAEAYGKLTLYDQKTEFYSALIPFEPAPHPFGIPQKPKEEGETPRSEAPKREQNPAAPVPEKKPGEERKLDRTLRLFYAEPNLLRMEMEENDATTSRPVLRQWVSDGKLFWTYVPEKNWYTREKAPGRMTGFQKLQRMNSGSIEMLMLMGVNPFADIKQQADSVEYAGTAVVRGIVTDIVKMRLSTRMDETEMRLFIGRDDLLLRRMVTETTPVPGPAVPGKVGDPLDELVDAAQSRPSQQNVFGEDDPPAPEPTNRGTVPMRTRVSYDNIISSRTRFAFDTFEFKIPPGASMFGTINDFSHSKYTLKEMLKGLKRIRPQKH